MKEFYPLIVIGAIIGVLSIIFIIAYALMKDKKTAPRFVILSEANGTPKTPISEILRVAQNDRCFLYF